ncbi:PucR family transcriptional regulator [Irregularibacter muris]|uniref:PucR family transcriptional regulator n=1 Tax=Irregularibacter muris TaxID=1796619 RepID=A0AAE3L0M1_9FIRM|nr:PucR family transcriptional regulator [Irregularibacter muris]MCR1900167.1 PucR family transcriptional regulator [Irregularibacter muris]
MGVTVKDCLNLPAFEGAEVVAGKGGLGNTVSTCSVLEMADTNVFKESYFGDNELIITAFASVKDDVGAQCKIIKSLNEIGTAGLVLYYVGVVVKKINHKMIAIADGLDFPIIIIGLDIGYSEVISQVLESVFVSKRQENQFSGVVLQKFAELSDSKRNYKQLLRIINEQIPCTLILCDGYLEFIEAWYEEGMESLNIKDLVSQVQKQGYSERVNQHIIELPNGQVCRIYLKKIRRSNIPSMYLMFLSPKSIEDYNMNQAIQVINSANEIWDLDMSLNNSSLLLRAILNNDAYEISKITSILQIKPEKWSTFWYVGFDEDGFGEKNPLNTQRLVKLVKGFLKDQRRVALIDYLDNAAVAIISTKFVNENIDELAETFTSILGENGICARVVSFNIATIFDIHRQYQMIKDNWKYLTNIYPLKEVLNLFQVQFTKQCIEIITAGQVQINKELEILDLLYEDKGILGDEFIHTLEVYLLDSDSNTAMAADLLHVHNNTVKYRIRKIKEKLGEKIFELPASFYLYRVAALNRIINKRLK